MDSVVSEPLVDGYEIALEVYDDRGRYMGTWDYEIDHEALVNWEELDTQDPDRALALVRVLILSRLKKYSPLTWELLTNNTRHSEFLADGVPAYIMIEIPLLSCVNAAVRSMYTALSNLALEENVRTIH
jgi:hypothetical protein